MLHFFKECFPTFVFSAAPQVLSLISVIHPKRCFLPPFPPRHTKTATRLMERVLGLQHSSPRLACFQYYSNA